MDTELTTKSIKRDNTRLFVCSCVSAVVLTIAVVALPLHFRFLAGITGEIDATQQLQVHIDRKTFQSSHSPRVEARSIAEQPRIKLDSRRENEPVITASRDALREIRIPVQKIETSDQSKSTKDWRKMLLSSAAKTVAASSATSYITFDRPRREDSATLHGPASQSTGSEAGLELPGQLGFAECPPNASYYDSMRDNCLRMCTPWPSKKRLFTMSDLSQ